MHITRTDALAAGVTDRQLSGPAYRRLFAGVHLAAGTEPTPYVIARAALTRFGDGASVSHTTAARLYDVPLPHLVGDHVTVTGPNDRRRLRGIRCHLIPGTQALRHGDIWASTPAQTFIDLASLLDLDDLIIAGDHLVRRHVSRDELVRFVDGSRQHGVVPARRALALVRSRVDSPMETRLRLLLIRGGLPDPEVNPKMIDAFGKPRRYDLLYRRSRTIVEYDGRQHAEDTGQWHTDLVRREALDRSGWRIIVVTARDFYGDPAGVVDRVRQVLRVRGEFR